MLQGIGKMLLFAGGILAVLGIIFILAGRFHIPIGRFPGDMVIRKPGFELFVPLVSMLIVSILLTVIVNVVFRFFR